MKAMASIAAAFGLAGLAVWLAPGLLELAGFGDFKFLGQLGLVILILSGLEAVLSRHGS